MEFTLYDVKETTGSPPTTTTNQYVKKEDIESVFKKILSLDLEKYTFYQAFNKAVMDTGSVYYYTYPCNYIYTEYTDSDMFRQINTITAYETELVKMNRTNGTIEYDASLFIANVVNSLPGEVVDESSQKIILYYKEL